MASAEQVPQCKCVRPGKPIALFGHERSVTQIKYNREGDLLFSTAKDTTPNIWYSVNGERLGTFEGHSGAVWCIDVDWESQKAITGSADNTMRMWDIKTGKNLNDFLVLVELPDLVHMKTFKTERPVNSAAISPIKNHVLLGGGQEAMDVTTTSGRIGKFDARFYHAIFEEEFGRVKGHFGPINSVAFHPDGMGYSSGGEDGYVRVHSFDPNYFEFEFEY
eukprot:XP_011665419.1 PREDICTED: eukaryotic translation initiation factor 3 subunit I-like [Strongylocentrotus purpuratus]